LNQNKNHIIGVDGCRYGWLAISLNKHDVFSFSKHRTIDDLFEKYSNADSYLIDMPIGLSDKNHPRLVEKLARPFLKPNKTSTIFSVPCRSAVYAKNYQSAKEKNLKEEGKSISIQSWNITPKIKELNSFLKNNNTLTDKIFEAHPELCFAKLNFGTPMFYKKNTPEGISERLTLLEGFFPKIKNIFEKGREEFLKKDVKSDDIIDALILVTTGFLGKKYGYDQLIIKRETDAFGIPFNMVFFDRNRI